MTTHQIVRSALTEIIQGKFKYSDCDEIEECEDCGGTGEISEMEAVYPGEPHMANVGSRPCHCQIKDEDDAE